MQKNRYAKQLFVVAGLCLTQSWGCAEPGADEEGSDEQVLDVQTEAIISGTKDTTMTAVGKVSASLTCTGTLISSRVVLTAAICFGDTTKSGLGTSVSPPVYGANQNNGTFTMFAANGTPTVRTIRRFALLQNGYGAMDLAVAELDSDVPTSVATPLSVATAEPANGATVRGFGFGCTGGDGSSGTWMNVTWPAPNTRTTRSTTWNTSSHTMNNNLACSGDSGGPILNASNQIVATFSSGSGNGGAQGTDGVARAWAYWRWISVINAIYGNRQQCTGCYKAALRTYDGVHFVQATSGGGSGVTAGTTNSSTWETFKVAAIAQPGTTAAYIALQASNGQWVSAENGGGTTLVANRDFVGAWETFWSPNASNVAGLLPNASVTTVLATIGNPRQFVTAEEGGGSAVNANRPSADIWETFTAIGR